MKLNNLVFDEASVLNSKMLDLALERQKVLANNIANSDTPGYTRLELDFQKKLNTAIQSGNVTEIENVRGKIEKDEKMPARFDGNNVVLPAEMNEMMQNGVLYNLLTKALGTKMTIIRNAISTK